MAADGAAASTGDVLGAAGACPEIEHGGKVYRLGYPTGGARATLEELVAKYADDSLLALRGVYAPERFAAEMEAHNARLRRREYRVGRAIWNEVMGDEEAAGLLFALALFRQNHPDLTADDLRGLMAAEPDRVKAALIRVVPDFLRGLGRELSLTPRQTEELTAQAQATLSALTTG